MPDNETKKAAQAEAPKLEVAEKPLIFISHDTRDAELAEAFAKLLTNVSAGVLKSFRSSDRKGRQGIEYGVEWYPELMKQLDRASDVVCLLTPRSTDRPWILYEAGVAKGKLGTPVYGIALGISLTKASSGPFAQFQNCDDDEESLTKLVMQLVERIPGSEPDHDAILMQVRMFKAQVAKLLTKSSPDPEQDSQSDTNAIAKKFEEIKVMFGDLPGRIETSIRDQDHRYRRRRKHRMHPAMLAEIAHMMGSRSAGQEVALLMLVCSYRDDYPWLYELGMDVYHAAREGSASRLADAAKKFMHVVEFTVHGPFREELGIRDDESHMMLMELPRFVDRMMEAVAAESSKRVDRKG